MINYVTSIRPGRTSDDTKVVDISQLQYNHAGLSYKLEHTADKWTPLPQRLKEVDLTITLQKLNTYPLPITQNKWKELQALKAVIPSDFHSFYDQLPKKMNDTVSLQYMCMCCEIVHFLYLLSLFDSFILLFVHMYEYTMLELSNVFTKLKNT